MPSASRPQLIRGMEYGEATAELAPGPGEERLIELAPRRIYDAAARGWYGGDMHVHLNWAGDLVGAPADAAVAQHGEDLHVLDLLAGNVSGRRVYDREALERWTDVDLPWSDATHVGQDGRRIPQRPARPHLRVRAAPGRYHTGFAGDADWPPNADGLRELRGLGALVGYSHPFRTPIADGDPPKGIVSPVWRNRAARELVADVALGLVDSLDVPTHASIPSTAAVYRRLIGAGNRLAVTAGTDAMISFTRSGNQSRGSASASRPPPSAPRSRRCASARRSVRRAPPHDDLHRVRPHQPRLRGGGRAAGRPAGGRRVVPGVLDLLEQARAV